MGKIAGIRTLQIECLPEHAPLITQALKEQKRQPVEVTSFTGDALVMLNVSGAGDDIYLGSEVLAFINGLED